MKKERVWMDYAGDMYDNAQKALTFVEGMTFSEFEANEQVQYAVVRALELIGEAAKHIPDDVADRYPMIPWRSIRGMRDKLVHAYFGVDLLVVWLTVQEDLPILLTTLAQMQSDFDSGR